MKNKLNILLNGLGIFILLFFLMAFMPSHHLISSQNDLISGKNELCYMPNTTFQDKERIVYKVYYNLNFVWIPAGEVVFNVKENDTQYHLSAVGRTYSSYEWFYRVRDYYDSYLDKNSLLPTTSIRNVYEGKYRLYDKVVYEQTNRKAISYRGTTDAETTRKDYPLQNCIHDVLSIVYYARNIDFNNYQVGAEFPVRIFLDEVEYNLKFRYKGKQERTKVHGMGRYKTIKFTPQLVSDRVFKDGAEMNIWVSDDKNRIPLLIESPVSVGSVKVVLKEYEGLKYDFTAKVE